jgi:hypothetical protein
MWPIFVNKNYLVKIFYLKLKSKKWNHDSNNGENPFYLNLGGHDTQNLSHVFFCVLPCQGIIATISVNKMSIVNVQLSPNKAPQSVCSCVYGAKKSSFPIPN